MKILHVINSLATAGAERLVVDMAIGMKEMGHEVNVVVLNSHRTPFYMELEQAGVPLCPLGMNEYNPLASLRLRRFMQKYDVVHAHLFPTQYWVAIARSLTAAGAAVVTTEHSTYNSRCKYRVTTWTDRWVYRHYDAISCISSATLDFMQGRTQGKCPLQMIPNGITTQRFREARGDKHLLLPDVPAQAFILMQVARFQEAKNQDCVIRALKRLPADVYAVFVGDGERLDTCRQLAASLGVAGRVRFLGVRADIPELMSVADIVVMSSHWEGFGLSAAEGMAAGKPVLASDVEGLADVVNNRHLLFAPDDDAELAKKILTLRADATMSEQLALWCRHRAEQFDVKNMVAQYINFYSETIKRVRTR